MKLALKKMPRAVLVLTVAVVLVGIGVLAIWAVGRKPESANQDATQPVGETVAENHPAVPEHLQIPEEEHEAYIAAKLEDFKKLPPQQRAEEIWELWKRIRYGEDSWYDWIDHYDTLFDEFAKTGNAGLTILLEQFDVDSMHLLYDACYHFDDFGIEAMYKVLEILEKGTAHQKGWALTALQDSFVYQDLPDEERARIRTAVEAVLDHESADVRETAEQTLRALTWNMQQSNRDSREEEHEAHIAAKLEEFKKLPPEQRAKEIWGLWKRIKYGVDSWYDWVDHEDTLFDEFAKTGNAGLTVLLEQFDGDSGRLLFDACNHFDDFGIEAMYKVLEILQNGTDLQKWWALNALDDSFVSQDFPDEERARIREALEAVLDHESADVREKALEIFLVLTWDPQQSNRYPQDEE